MSQCIAFAYPHLYQYIISIAIIKSDVDLNITSGIRLKVYTEQ
jgi:hypothetical protein